MTPVPVIVPPPAAGVAPSSRATQRARVPFPGGVPGPPRGPTLCSGAQAPSGAQGSGPIEGAVIDAGTKQVTSPPGGLDGWVAAWQPEEGALAAARQRAAEVGVGAVDPVTGALLRLLAATVGARAVVEIGTGAGVSTLWLLAGMRPDGVLTSVDAEPEHQRQARLSITEAGVAPGRVRLITGRALDVLPRLSDGAYDLVLCDAARGENADYLAAALRLLRSGGLVLFAGALAGGRVAEPSARDADTVALRDLARLVREEPRLVPALLPVGAGLLAAVVGDPA